MRNFNYIALLDSISRSYNKDTVKEDFDYFEAKYRLNDLCLSGFRENLSACFSDFQRTKDEIIVQIDFSCGESFASVGNAESFIDEVEDWATDGDFDCVNITIKIEKNHDQNLVNIYSLADFEASLKTISLCAGLNSWSSFNLNKKLLLVSHRDFKKVKTSWIELCGSCEGHLDQENPGHIIRKDYQAKRDSASHFANASEFHYLPEDFEVTDGLSTDLGQHLNSIHKTLLIVYLSDFSEIIRNSVKYSLNGYKTISGTLELKDLESNSCIELKEIYKYVFIGGSFTDKIGLARNVISLHTHGASLSKIEPGTLASIKSGYNVYLKDNIKQYIDIKNKLLEFLMTQTDKAAEVGRGLFASFKMKFWAFSTFFVSVFLLRSLSKTTDEFINEAVVIPGIILVLVSLIYLFIMIREGRYEEKVIKERFDDIEQRYRDLLDEKDLRSILSSEQNKAKISRTINGAIKTYRNAWIGTSFLFLLFLFWWWKSAAEISFSQMLVKLFT